MSGKKQTIQKCLETIGVGSDIFSDCNNVQEEFSKIKKAYFRKVLVAHPDKGGDPELFRAVQTSFEVLRDLFDSARVDSFATSAEQSTAEAYNGAYEDFGQMPTPSWEYYYSAAEEAVPTYRVELAKSGRSACKQKGKAKKCFGEAPENPPYIAKDEIRIGSIEQESGSYSRWVHLGCWRVPSKVWLGLPDSNPDPATCLCRDPAQFESALLSMNEVLLCGLRDLSKSDRDKVVRHVMDKNNWAKFVNRKPPSESVYSKVAGASKVGRASDSLMTGQASTDIVQQGFHAPRSHFILPVPGRDGFVECLTYQ